ncbi:MAG: hypothetical protein HYZ75_08925 [Elusimicrobia bacterium]|nr:hypothetical protein [Elusimicrobiota bacterium]
MAQYRKRRIAHGPNKNEEKVRRGQEAETRSRSTSLGERFPAVDRLILELTVTAPQDGSVERSTRDISADQGCELTLGCPGRCGRGVFDLAAMVTAAVEAKNPAATGAAVCQEPFLPGLPDVCGVKVDCRLTITFKP